MSDFLTIKNKLGDILMIFHKGWSVNTNHLPVGTYTVEDDDRIIGTFTNPEFKICPTCRMPVPRR